MKNKFYCLMLICALFMISCNKSKDASNSDYRMSVNVALPKVDTVLLHKSYPGFLTARPEVNLVARVNGFLQKADYKAGDYVKKGQLLFVIEPKPYQDAVRQAEAELVSAKSQNEYALTNYESTKEAAKTNAVSQIDLAQAEANLKKSIAAVNSAEASLENAKTNLSYCYIRAPFNGHITSKSVDIGNFLNGSASPQILATIYDDQAMTVTFTIEDRQYMRMVTAQQNSKANNNYNIVDISFNESLPHKYSGELSYLSPMVDLSTGTITLQAKIDNPYGELKSGMYCVVDVPYEKLNNALLIKDSAISTDQLGKFIYIVNDSNRVVYTPIEIGDLIDDSLRIVTAGLKPTQKYVTQAIQKVRDGMSVNPKLTTK